MLKKLFTSTKFIIIVYIFTHFFNLFPLKSIFNRIKTIFNSTKSYVDNIADVKTREIAFSVFIVIIGIFIFTTSAWKSSWSSRVSQIVLWIVENLPMVLIIISITIIILLIKDAYHTIITNIENWYKNSIIKEVINTIQEDIKPTINRVENVINTVENKVTSSMRYLTCLTELPDGYSDCLNRPRVQVATLDPTAFEQLGTRLAEREESIINLLQSKCTDSTTLQNFIKNNTTCSSLYINESSNNPEIGFGCSNSRFANNVLKSINPSATDLTFREDTRDTPNTFDQNSILKCNDFLTYINNVPQCVNAYQPISGSITGDNPKQYTVPTNLDNITYSTLVGCEQQLAFNQIAGSLQIQPVYAERNDSTLDQFTDFISGD